MNKILLTTMISAAAIAGSASVLAYDNFPPSGGRAIEYHALSDLSTPGGFCAGSCFSVGGGGGSETSIYMAVINKSPQPAPASPAPAVIDVTDCSVDTAPSYVSADVYIPSFGIGTETSATGEAAVICELTSNALGKIVSGYYSIENTIFGSPFWNYYDIATRTILTYESCTTSPTAAEYQAQIVDPGNAALSPNTCAVTTTRELEYFTCDITGECGQLEKSVPVPALAAAGLALGLVGITYLTGRRRMVK